MALPVVHVHIAADETEHGTADAVVEVDLEAVQRDPLAWRLIQLAITVDWEGRSARLMPESESHVKPVVRTPDLEGLLYLAMQSVVARGWSLRELRRQAAAATIRREMGLPEAGEPLGPDPGTDRQPFFIPPECASCGAKLRSTQSSETEASPWFDEWRCDCPDNPVHFDWPPAAIRELQAAIEEAESEFSGDRS